MQHLYNLIVGLIVGLFSLIVAAIAVIEHGARVALMRIGIGGEAQTALLALLLLALIVVALRLFGRLFGVLIAILLVLVLLHALFAPGMSGTLSF
ncbi:hypothetical protein AA101099_2726 [Neoasaia chiangmaiensis NBRC 101099]|uniref:Uncharacterized protein n=1 Tax=Neoasaia chiangmaiensis TaxID=320497 RepID=A0A1U9KPK3_9PROT|nr:hypothetical protein [Neoasaia chiangmaiensis]AQS87630.1 hypothetical protein A0U93_06425 [Neoasaia chiangmaiensis]GBR42057.1 hypothetical protein AA101099_2726 [Neoasaia chiangmaiensis NBRC 101099]GEN14197.1 hypothetical protein NCH01_06280 [Neoasaia chiangmaiensis]